MIRLKRLVVFGWLLVTFAVPPQAGAQSQPPAPQGEFVPIDQLPAGEQFPAAPLLVAAYVFVLLALFVYMASLARRMGIVQRELERLEKDMKQNGRA